MGDSTADPVVALREEQDELVRRVEGLDDEELRRPSRCDGWTVADVLLHLAQTNELAVASVEGRPPEVVDRMAAGAPTAGSVDDLAGALVDAQRGEPAEARDRYLASNDAQVAAFRSVDPAARVRWVAGELAARTLATTRLAETWIHSVDVAVAFGPEPEPTGRLWHVARLAWRTLPYAFSRAGRELSGPVAVELDAPDGGTWRFTSEQPPLTVVRGSAHELCTVAGQRAAAGDTGLVAEGPDAASVLELVRTFA